jgi:hypothetical protein
MMDAGGFSSRETLSFVIISEIKEDKTVSGGLSVNVLMGAPAD